MSESAAGARALCATLMHAHRIAVAHNRATVRIGNRWERIANVLSQRRDTVATLHLSAEITEADC